MNKSEREWVCREVCRSSTNDCMNEKKETSVHESKQPHIDWSDSAFIMTTINHRCWDRNMFRSAVGRSVWLCVCACVRVATILFLCGFYRHENVQCSASFKWFASRIANWIVCTCALSQCMWTDTICAVNVRYVPNKNYRIFCEYLRSLAHLHLSS